MFEKFFGKIKKFFKKGNFEQKRDICSNKKQSSSDEQSDETLGDVSGGQSNMPPGPHGPK